MRLATRSPFTSPTELIQLHSLLYPNLEDSSPSPSSIDSLRSSGVSLISVYLNRSCCPHAIESTSFLIQSELLDSTLHSSFSTLSPSCISISCRLSYSSSLIRFVNSLVDSSQTGYFAQSIINIAKIIGLPIAFVELRHQATHEELPSLSSLREATAAALRWLDVHYWQPTISSLSSTSSLPPPPPPQPQLQSSDPKFYSSSSSSLRSYGDSNPHHQISSGYGSSSTSQVTSLQLSTLQKLLKSYKRVSKTISKDFSMRGTLRRDLETICGEIESWISEVGIFLSSPSSSFHQNPFENPNLILLRQDNVNGGLNLEGRKRVAFDPSRFDLRKRRRNSGSEDEEDLESETNRKDAIQRLGLELFIKELLQIGGLVPLGRDKRTEFHPPSTKAKGKGKGKEEMKEIMNHDELNQTEVEGEVGAGIEAEGEEIDQEETEKEEYQEDSKEFSPSGIQVLPSQIHSIWNPLLSHFSKIGQDFFTPLLVESLVKVLEDGIPLIKTSDEPSNSSSNQDWNSTSELNPKFSTSTSNPSSTPTPTPIPPKSYTSTILSWLLYLLEASKSEASYGMVAQVKVRGWEILRAEKQSGAKKNPSVKQFLESKELDVRKPRNRLGLICLSLGDGGKSALPILKHLASPPALNSQTTSNNSQDLILSQTLLPIIELLEKSSLVSEPTDFESKDLNSNQELNVRVEAEKDPLISTTPSTTSTGFEDSIKLMRQRLEAMGNSKTSHPKEDEEANPSKKARFSQDLEISRNSEAEESESEEEDEEAQEEEQEMKGMNSDPKTPLDGKTSNGRSFRNDSLKNLVGWAIWDEKDWKPTPIGMLRGEVGKLEVDFDW